VQHHPWRAALLSTALLLLLTAPLAGLRLGFTDQGNDPPASSTRKAYDLLAEGFGRGFNGPLALVSALPDGTKGVARVSGALQDVPGVAFASPAVFDDEDQPAAVLWHVIPDGGPQDEETSKLVHRLRDDVLPRATAGTGLDVAVTGGVAADIDFSDYVAKRLVWFFAAVLAISFLLLLAVFRSVLVPIKAVLMNLLSIGAAYGVAVAVFQWGWFGSVFHVDGGPIEPFVPMMLFAIVFGLSMDYEVFLLSRIREEWERTGDAKTSVADGLAATARVITAAAAIMVFVFGSFLGESNRVVKVIGTALGVAVFLDATIVRMILVPATMELLGDRNWWFPRWLDRLLPRFDVEGPSGVQRDLDRAAGPIGGDAERLGGIVEREAMGDERAGDVRVGGQHGRDLVDLTDPVVPLVGHGAGPRDLLDERGNAGDGHEAVVDAKQDHAPTGPDQL
jgi:RND superfamily putative drug exporter